MGIQISECGFIGANTGPIKCDSPRGQAQQLIFGGKVFSNTEMLTQLSFQAALLAAMQLPNGNGSKLFPLPSIQGTADQTEAATFTTLGYGLKIKTRRSRAGYEFTIPVGTELERHLIKFDGQNVPVLILDSKSNIYGVYDSTNGFYGYNCLVGVEVAGFQDDGGARFTKVTISIVDPTEFVENSYYVTTTLASSQMRGLTDVEVTKLSNASNVYKYKLYANNGNALNGALGLDLYDNINSAMATAIASAALWPAFTGASLTTPLTITSVAVDTTLKAWTVTYDSTLYAALATGAQILQTLAPADVLNTASVSGIEGVPQVVIK